MHDEKDIENEHQHAQDEDGADTTEFISPEVFETFAEDFFHLIYYARELLQVQRCFL